MARTAIHPGEHLADELKELGMSAAELARQVAVPVNRITQIINGRRAITADTALRLGHWFNTGPEVWLNLQQLYELRRAREALGAEIERLPKRSEAVAGNETEPSVGAQAPRGGRPEVDVVRIRMPNGAAERWHRIPANYPAGSFHHLGYPIILTRIPQ